MTGDAGFFDDDGHLKIIDRAKDVGRLVDGTLAEKLLDQRPRPRHLRGHAPQLGGSILWAFKHEAVADQTQVQLVSGGESQGSANLCRDDQSPLLAQDQRGIHEARMPPLAHSCHGHLVTEVPGRTLEPGHTAA